jgi:hypothetical protein
VPVAGLAGPQAPVRHVSRPARGAGTADGSRPSSSRCGPCCPGPSCLPAARCPRCRTGVAGGRYRTRRCGDCHDAASAAGRPRATATRRAALAAPLLPRHGCWTARSTLALQPRRTRLLSADDHAARSRIGTSADGPPGTERDWLAALAGRRPRPLVRAARVRVRVRNQLDVVVAVVQQVDERRAAGRVLVTPGQGLWPD